MFRSSWYVTLISADRSSLLPSSLLAEGLVDFNIFLNISGLERRRWLVLLCCRRSWLSMWALSNVIVTAYSCSPISILLCFQWCARIMIWFFLRWLLLLCWRIVYWSLLLTPLGHCCLYWLRCCTLSWVHCSIIRVFFFYDFELTCVCHDPTVTSILIPIDNTFIFNSPRLHHPLLELVVLIIHAILIYNGICFRESLMAVRNLLRSKHLHLLSLLFFISFIFNGHLLF